MKKLSFLLCVLLTSCANTDAKNAMISAKESCKIKYPLYVGNAVSYANCVDAAERNYASSVQNASSSAIDRASVRDALARQVDSGQISINQANEEFRIYSSKSHHYNSSSSALSIIGTAMTGVAVAGRAFQNGYNQGIANYRPTYQYQSPTSCMTQPSGGGFVTSCNH